MIVSVAVCGPFPRTSALPKLTPPIALGEKDDARRVSDDVLRREFRPMSGRALAKLRKLVSIETACTTCGSAPIASVMSRRE